MNPNMSILEASQIVWGFGPIDIGSNRTGDVVSLKNYRRCLVLLVKGLGPAGDDPTLTIEQGTDVAFGTNKPLTFTTVYVKEDLTQLSDVGQWTKVTQAAAGTYTHGDAAESVAMWAVDFKAEDLDIANGYDCIRASVADAGTATQLAVVLYVLYDPIVSTAPQSMASAIVD